jgi:hypothetical protein
VEEKLLKNNLSKPLKRENNKAHQLQLVEWRAIAQKLQILRRKSSFQREKVRHRVMFPLNPHPHIDNWSSKLMVVGTMKHK